MSKKYYIPGVDEIHQLVETPASKEKTERKRYIVNTAISIVGAVTGIIAAVVSILAYFK